jgi:hypothetical protein
VWADGDLIVEIDDCCVGMPRDLLERHLQWSVKGFAVTGSWAINGWTDERQERYPQATQVGPEMFYGANCSFMLEKAVEVNGFDEYLDGEQGQVDIVLGFMMSRADVRFIYDPTLNVDFHAPSHTLTQLSPDPRKSQWGKEPWAVEPKKKMMDDRTLHYANEWLAHETIASDRTKPQGNHFKLSDLRRIPPDLHYDVDAVQRRLLGHMDPDPTDWRDGEQISEMAGGDLVVGRGKDTVIAAGRARYAAISEDLNQIAIMSGSSLRRYTRAARMREEVEPDIGINGICISPVTRTLCVASRSTRIYGTNLSQFEDLRESEDVVQALCFSRSERLLSAGGWDSAVRVWHFATRKVIRSFSKLSASVTTVAFLDDEKHLIAGTADGYTYLWNVDSGELLSRRKRFDRPVCVLLPFTQSGRPLILLGSGNGTLAICDTESPDTSPLPPEHADKVRHAYVTPNGSYAVTAGSDGEVLVWDLRTRSLLQTLLLQEPAIAVRLSVESHELLAVTSAGNLFNWQVNPRLLSSETSPA